MSVGQDPGPWLGDILERLLETVVEDPSRNTREDLIATARSMLASLDGAAEAAP